MLLEAQEGAGAGTKQSECEVRPRDHDSAHGRHSWQPDLPGEKPERGDLSSTARAHLPSGVTGQSGHKPILPQLLSEKWDPHLAGRWG